MKFIQANGAQIPALGFGTFGLKDEVCVEMVSKALNSGYTHIDTAAMYDNEKAVGEGIRASGKARDELFITTKVWPTEIQAGAFERSVEASLDRLGMDAVDLLLIHWPPKNNQVVDWAKLLNGAAERGWAKNIGVSNFTVSLLDQIVSHSQRPIAVNQVENHPYLDQSKIRAACHRHGVGLIAYCPLYKGGDLFSDAVVAKISQAHGKTPAQIVLRWHIQHEGAGAIPKTATPSRAVENIDIFDFELSEAEMSSLSGLSSKASRLCDFDFSPKWDAA